MFKNVLLWIKNRWKNNSNFDIDFNQKNRSKKNKTIDKSISNININVYNIDININKDDMSSIQKWDK